MHLVYFLVDTTDQIPLQTDKQKEEDTEITSDTASKRQKPTEEESIQLLAQFIILLGIRYVFIVHTKLPIYHATV